MRAVAIVVGLCGCDQLFNLDHVDPSDAARVDTVVGDVGFDLETCPDNYDLPLYPGSLYRISRGGTPIAHYDACATDSTGITHLAVLESLAEQRALEAKADELDNLFYVGVVQRATATTTDSGWMWLTGEAVLGTQWGSNEPNDVDGTENDHWEQFALLHDSVVGLVDYHQNHSFDAICECDGRQVTTDARDIVDSYR